jgi:ribosomal protein S18 acetylase RimI-like enzyme
VVSNKSVSVGINHSSPKDSGFSLFDKRKDCLFMNIRNANIDDLQEIVKVERECFPVAEAATEADFKKRLEVYPNHFWLLYDDETLVGFVNGMVTDEMDLQDEMYNCANYHCEDGKWQMIFGVVTRPSYRNRGCAATILNQVITDAKSQGRLGLVLTCKAQLCSYYGKFGFIDEGISESVHGNVVWHQMRLTL